MTADNVLAFPSKAQSGDVLTVTLPLPEVAVWLDELAFTFGPVPPTLVRQVPEALRERAVFNAIVRWGGFGDERGDWWETETARLLVQMRDGCGDEHPPEHWFVDCVHDAYTRWAPIVSDAYASEFAGLLVRSYRFISARFADDPEQVEKPAWNVEREATVPLDLVSFIVAFREWIGLAVSTAVRDHFEHYSRIEAAVAQ